MSKLGLVTEHSNHSLQGGDLKLLNNEKPKNLGFLGLCLGVLLVVSGLSVLGLVSFEVLSDKGKIESSLAKTHVSDTQFLYQAFEKSVTAFEILLMQT